MNKNLKIYGLILLGVVFILGLISGVNAYRQRSETFGSHFSPEMHEDMQEAFANKDYAFWKSIREQNGLNGRVDDLINEDNFAKFIDLRTARLEGNPEEEEKLRSELGLERRDRFGKNFEKTKSRGKFNKQSQSGSGFVDFNGDGLCDNFE